MTDPVVAPTAQSSASDPFLPANPNQPEAAKTDSYQAADWAEFQKWKSDQSKPAPSTDPFTVPSDAATTPNSASVDTVHDVPADATVVNPPTQVSNPDRWIYFQNTDGSYDRVERSEIQDAPTKNTTSKQTLPPPSAQAADEEQEFYVWLADGSVERVAQADLPTAAGTNAAFGHWQREDKVFTVVGIYPAESVVKGDK